jgi:hypothetical protein
MASQQKFGTTAIVASFMLGLFALAATSPTHAQALPPATEAALVAANDLDPDTAFVTAANDETPLSADPSAQTTTAPASKASSDDQWHFAVTPYLWFPSFYGNIGLPNRDLDVHASAGKLLSHFRFGLMGRLRFVGSGCCWVLACFGSDLGMIDPLCSNRWLQRRT